MSLRVLVVDDEKLARVSTVELLVGAGHEAEGHETPFTALAALEQAAWDLVLSDVRMPTMDGIELLREINRRGITVSTILMTAYGTIENAVRAMREGAVDYLLKPFTFDELDVRLKRLEGELRTRRELASLRRAVGTLDRSGSLVGSSPAMQRVFDLIAKAAPTESNVLIVGETGTGKELTARAIHLRSLRSAGPFVPVACGAIPKDLAESELFGHEQGAFTGATRRRMGRVEMAQRGTLFLDDVDDLPLDIQVKLLRVIQERKFERVGGEQTHAVDLRIVAATKVDLESWVRKGRFREDLFFRLNVLPILLPPLRERREDILPIALHFLAQYSNERGTPPKSISVDAANRLQTYDWPGNVRELRHAIEHAMALSRAAEIQVEDLPASVRPVDATSVLSLSLENIEKLDLRGLLEGAERQCILWALKRAEGNQAAAAERLGLARTTLQNRIRQLRIR